MEQITDLAGKWQVWLEKTENFEAALPGTLDTNGIGLPDTAKLATRLTRVYTWEGVAAFSKKVKLPAAEGGHLFLEAERARKLALKVDGMEVEPFVRGTLSTPYVFEVTPWAGKEAELTLLSDNSYEGWPAADIKYASAATDETQTNWNGILGYLRLRRETACFVEAVRVYPAADCGSVRVEVDVCGAGDGTTENAAGGTGSEPCGDWELTAACSAFADGEVSLSGDRVQQAVIGGRTTLLAENVTLKTDTPRWDEEEGNLCEVTVSLGRKAEEPVSCRTERFGLRSFGVGEGKRLTLNGRVFFLRGEANCCVFPEEGHPPMTVEGWKKVLTTYASYGVNCMRFHSWCPPEAAFLAADEMGMMMQPELSHWNPKDAFETEESISYYRLELESILRQCANHPSFVMLTFGNELQVTDKGRARMNELLRLARAADPTRLYANSSNWNYGEKGTDPESDFYTSSNYYREMLRATSSPMIGHLNESYPSACRDYRETVEKIHADGKPVFGFEVGQYEVLPEFGEIDHFRGVTRAVNLELIREAVDKTGQLKSWERYVEATGELALLGYREEVEAVLRTPGMSGLSLLGLQDFPGQGTALVGMLDSHLEPKPYDFAKPERFRKFFAPVLPLLFLERYTWEEGEMIHAVMKLANYGKTPVTADAGWRLHRPGSEEILAQGAFPEQIYPNQGLSVVGEAVIPCGKVSRALRLDVDIYVGKYENVYPLWVYPRQEEVQADTGADFAEELSGSSESIVRAEVMTGELLERIREGASVYLEPALTAEALPHSIGGQFSTDFWSVGTFPSQEGGMGLVINADHPALAQFPTETHSDWQWWSMSKGRPIILPEKIRPIVTVPDSYSRLKHMGLLAEFRVGRGRVMLSGMGLLRHQEHPEERALLHSILNYMESGEFAPDEELTAEELAGLTPPQGNACR